MSTKHTLEQLVNLSKDVFKTCSINDAIIELAGNRLVLSSFFSQLDIEKNERTKFQKNYLFDLDGEKPKLFYTTQPLPIRKNEKLNSLWNVKSPNNSLKAIVTNWKDSNEDNQFIEIWNNDTRLKNINLTKLDKHAKVYENSVCLGSFVWSSDSAKLAYIAEVKKSAKDKNFYNSKFESDAAKDDAKTKNDFINEKNYEQKYANFFNDDWGELYVGKSQSVIAVFDVNTCEVKVLENLPTGYVPAQITWYKNEGLVFNAYSTQPFKLGLIYCPIRVSELFYYDLKENKCTQITSLKTENLRDPRFSKDFENLCWLQNKANGPHHNCSQLNLMNWNTKDITTIIDVVKDINESFPGIYAVKFPQDCWSMDNKRILLNTGYRRTNRCLCVDIETKNLTIFDKNIDVLNSCDILKFSNDWLCGVVQGYNRPPALVLAKLPNRGQESNLEWLFVEQENSDKEVNVKLLKLEPDIKDQKYPNLYFESILVEPKQRNDVLIVFPHGGPHSAYGCEYSSHVAIFYRLGYSILMINYRGSINYGQDSIDSLPGKIGTNDVKDCQQAATTALKQFNFKQATLYGGSHGGYLTTQLIGQYPDFYKAASARNPVTNLETMLSLTDIPDWIITEGFGKYDFDFKVFGKKKESNDLYEKSPISHIDKVKTPTLLMIGNVDLRVPPSQGVEYYKALLARNVPSKLAQFKDDSHPLDKPQTTMDCILLTLLWYEKYLD